MKWRALIMTVMVVAAVGMTGCHSSRTVTEYDSIYDEPRRNRPATGKRPHRPADAVVPRKSTGVAADVIKAAEEWLGVPYRYAGDSKSGTDCSGLTCMAFEKGAGIKLPRSSREQAEYGKRINRSELRPGDLVFFVSKRGGSRINHVAIYLGDNKIIHSTTSRGVSVSDLDDDYWGSHYHSCCRVL